MCVCVCVCVFLLLKDGRLDVHPSVHKNSSAMNAVLGYQDHSLFTALSLLGDNFPTGVPGRTKGTLQRPTDQLCPY